MEASMYFEENQELAEKKLILLYVINKINVPVSNTQITKIILENRFMNYFYFQQFLLDLCKQNLLQSASTDGKVYYKITDKGREILNYFINHIPLGVKNRVDEASSSIKKKIKNETSVVADFSPENDNQFVVSCKINEDDFSLINLNITVGTKSDARKICDNWHQFPQEIYSEIIEILMQNRKNSI
jgi:predicted transcriptional regulator